MLAAEFHLKDDFPPTDYDEWRALAEADLAGASFEQKLITHTYEGIDLQPVYTRRDCDGTPDRDGFPGLPPFVRGGRPLGSVQSGWDLRQEHAHPNLVAANEAILEDVHGGVTSLHLRLDGAARFGLDPDDPRGIELAGRDGLMAYHVDDLDTLLDGVNLKTVGVTLEAGAAFLPAAAILVALWRQRAISPVDMHGAFNADPLAVLVRDGELPMPAPFALQMMADLAAWTAQNYPHVTTVRVGTAPYHHAGATAAQDIAFSMATAVEYLRAMSSAGMSMDAAARQILFSISVGTQHFLAIAKLRAARRLWGQVVVECGGAAGAMRVHARISKRVLTARDPYVNLVRNAVACFAAGLGGAEAITSVPFDVVAGLPDAVSRRIARNTVHILQQEAHLHQVIDPPGGSWYLDWLTDQLATKAWAIFQQIERQGGMLRAICDGHVAKLIDSAFAPRARNLARRKEGITGVSEFPNVAEERLVRSAPNRVALRTAAAQRIAGCRLPVQPVANGEMESIFKLAEKGASVGQLARALQFHAEPLTITPLAPHPFAEPFEEMRDAADRWQTEHGERPRVFLANMGSITEHTARATYAKNFFEVGGFGVVGNKGFTDADAATRAFTASGATVAVICSSDKLYPKVVPEVAPRLKAAGARSVVLAGNPAANETAFRAVGVDRFIYVKCDVLGTLREMLLEEGVVIS
jgi:methylmalonyl-CoA mutase